MLTIYMWGLPSLNVLCLHKYDKYFSFKGLLLLDQRLADPLLLSPCFPPLCCRQEESTSLSFSVRSNEHNPTALGKAFFWVAAKYSHTPGKPLSCLLNQLSNGELELKILVLAKWYFKNSTIPCFNFLIM